MEEKNKVIIEWMQYEKHGISYIIPNGAHLVDTFKTGDLSVLVEQLAFHKSWDWLMLIVERIEEMGYYVTIEKTECIINDFDNNILGSKLKAKSKIKAVHEAVYEFIINH